MQLITTLNSFYAKSFLFILAICFGLFYLDKDTHSISDLLRDGNWIAFALYLLPTYLMSSLLYHFLYKKGKKYSAILALALGIPLGLALVIVVMLISLGRL